MHAHDGAPEGGRRVLIYAGICLEAEAPLVTRNVAHFERVPGLRVSGPAVWW